MPTFYEFFAGGGMARAGLGPEWTCLFANDFDSKKAASYAANWGDEDLYVGDVNDVRLDQLPETADLAWASFPCQDLSLAGSGAGLTGARSGTFWPFWNHVLGLRDAGRAPKTRCSRKRLRCHHLSWWARLLCHHECTIRRWLSLRRNRCECLTLCPSVTPTAVHHRGARRCRYRRSAHFRRA